jgi:hypothetical protein
MAGKPEAAVAGGYRVRWSRSRGSNAKPEEGGSVALGRRLGLVQPFGMFRSGTQPATTRATHAIEACRAPGVAGVLLLIGSLACYLSSCARSDSLRALSTYTTEATILTPRPGAIYGSGDRVLLKFKAGGGGNGEPLDCFYYVSVPDTAGAWVSCFSYCNVDAGRPAGQEASVARGQTTWDIGRFPTPGQYRIGINVHQRYGDQTTAEVQITVVP